jgi:hypothetical protein
VALIPAELLGPLRALLELGSVGVLGWLAWTLIGVVRELGMDRQGLAEAVDHARIASSATTAALERLTVVLADVGVDARRNGRALARLLERHRINDPPSDRVEPRGAAPGVATPVATDDRGEAE